jgi:hypothetical protein
MTDDEQTEAAPSMDDIIRGRRNDYQHAARERLFRPVVEQQTETAPTDTDNDDNNGSDAA